MRGDVDDLEVDTAGIVDAADEPGEKVASQPPVGGAGWPAKEKASFADSPGKVLEVAAQGAGPMAQAALFQRDSGVGTASETRDAPGADESRVGLR